METRFNIIDIRDVLETIIKHVNVKKGRKYEVVIPSLDAKWLKGEYYPVKANLKGLDVAEDNGRGGHTDLLIRFKDNEFRIMGDFHTYKGSPKDSKAVWAHYCTYEHFFSKVIYENTSTKALRYTTYRVDWKEVSKNGDAEKIE